MSETTRIANRDVRVEREGLVTVHFSGGAGGESEAGAWEFWAIFNDKFQGHRALSPELRPWRAISSYGGAAGIRERLGGSIDGERYSARD
jgi:hypothetical protein